MFMTWKLKLKNYLESDTPLIQMLISNSNSNLHQNCVSYQSFGKQ
jgi:hypothetical protein